MTTSRPRRPWRMSLRARLLLITTALLATGLIVSGSIVIGMLRANLVDRVDKQLRSLSGLAALLPLLPSDILGRQNPQETRNRVANLDLVTDLYVAVLTPSGTVQQEVRLPARHDETGPSLPALTPSEITRRAQHPFDTPDRTGPGTWRVLALPRPAIPGLPTGSPRAPAIPGLPTGSPRTPTTPGTPSATPDTPTTIPGPPSTTGGVVVAVSMDGVTSTVARLRAAILVTGAALLAVLTLTGLFAIRAGLRPLRRIEETAAAIAAGDLTRRVPEAGSTEIGRLSASLNGMLTQIEQAFAARADSEARLRRFVADVSHELRTPLSGIKGFTELHRLGGLKDVDQAMSRMETEATRLSRLVEDLLLLARLDEGGDALPLDLAPMDLRTLAADARLDLKALAPDREVTLTSPAGGPPAPALVLGDERRLRQVVTNLISNVVTHTPPGTPVRITVGTTPDTTPPEATLAVTDHGPGLTPAEAPHVFDRFYRTDPSRSHLDTTGTGLGLSIAHSLTKAHNGTLTLQTTPGTGATFTLTLPAITPPP